MKILCVLGEHNYGNPSRGRSYEYVNFLPALQNVGHQIVFFESLDKSVYQDFCDLNRKLLEIVVVENPDIIFCVLLGYEVWLETLHQLRNGTHAIIINWSTDDSWKYEQFSRYIAPAFHLYATTYLEAIIKSRKDGFDNFVLTQWAANSSNLAEPLPAAQCCYKVSFVGSSYGNRPRWIKALRDNGIKVDCFGYGWENGAVPAEDIPRIMRNSIVSLNFGDSGIVMNGIIPGRNRQIKARIFEVPGAGGFLMTEPADDLDKFYDIQAEIAVFSGVKDLVEKINYFLNHPDERDRIAMAGYLKTRDRHTYEKRFSKLLDAACKQQTVKVKQPVQIDSAAFNKLEQSYAMSTLLKWFKVLIAIPFRLIWGERRGSRAARKFLFELSWRLVGRKTYTAAGWPGRLFYWES